LLLGQRDGAVDVSFGGRSLLHYAAGAGAVETVKALLRQGADPHFQDRGGHPRLYSVANVTKRASPRPAVPSLEVDKELNSDGVPTKIPTLEQGNRFGVDFEAVSD